MVLILVSERTAPEKIQLGVLLATWVLLGAGLVWAAFLEISEVSQMLMAGTLIGLLVALKVVRPEGALKVVFVVLALFVSFRYIVWRSLYTVSPVTDLWVWVPGVALYLAELYGFAIAVLGAFVNINPVTRQSPSLPDDPASCPTVDVFITTYNEDPKILETTLVAATRMDYPADRFTVYVLDDGGTGQKLSDPDPEKAAAARARAERIQALCAATGAVYMTRARNDRAKAGNVNSALARTKGDLILILDADHAPTADFLRKTVGFFLRDPKLFLVQTPHFFINPDPVERNLRTFGRMPSEQEMFYGEVQRGLDFWNATFFCGSAAVLRRSCLEEIGGVSEDTVTEDAETALRLHARGYNSAYVSEPLVSGLQPETFQGFVIQRTRWTTGMVQIMLMHNPLFKRGLSLAQRLCYLNAGLFWFFPFARLVFLVAPLCYLLFGMQIYIASATEFVAYTVPHMAASLMMMNVMFGKTRWPLISELYELIQSMFTARAVLGTLWSPRKPAFRVTPKGETLDEDFLSPLAPPFYVMLGLIFVGFLFAGYRYVAYPLERDILAVVTLWNVFNTLMIGGALGVMCETRQRRVFPRMAEKRPVRVEVGGQVFDAEMLDLSGGGTRIAVPMAQTRHVPDDCVRLGLEVDLRSGRALRCDALVRSRAFEDGKLVLGLEFAPRTETERGDLIELFYSDSARWTAFLASHQKAPGVLLGIALFAILSLRYLGHALVFPFRIRKARAEAKAQARPAAKAAAVVLGLALAASATSAHAALDAKYDQFIVEGRTAEYGAFAATQGPDADGRMTVSFAALAARRDAIRLTGEADSFSLHFALARIPANTVEISIRHLSSVHALPERSTLVLAVNGAPVAEAPIEAFDAPELLTVAVPGRLFRAGDNILTIQATALHRITPGVEATYELWTRIDPEESTLTFHAADVADVRDLADPVYFLTGAPFVGRDLVIRSSRDEHAHGARIDAGALLAQTVSVLTAPAAVRVSSEIASSAAIDDGRRVVLLGTKAGLAGLLPDDYLARIDGPFLGMHIDANGVPRLVLSGPDWSAVRAAVSQLASSAAGTVPPVPERVEIPFRALGFTTMTVHGQRGVAEMAFRLPPDIYTGTDDPAFLSLNVAHVGELGTGAAMNISANGVPFTTLRLGEVGRLIEDKRLKMPTRLLRGGTNVIRFEVVLPAANDEDYAAFTPTSRRFALFDDSTLWIPTLVRIGRQPDLRLLLDTGYPFGANAANRPGAIVLAAPDPDTISAGWMAAAALARGAGGLIEPLPVVVGRPIEPALAAGNLLVVGASADLRGFGTGRDEAGAWPDHVRALLRKMPGLLGPVAPGRVDADQAARDLLRHARESRPELYRNRALPSSVAAPSAAEERRAWARRLQIETRRPTEASGSRWDEFVRKWRETFGESLLNWWADVGEMPAFRMLGEQTDLGVLMGGAHPRSGDGATIYVFTAPSHAALAARAPDLLRDELRRVIDGDVFIWGPGQPPVSVRAVRPHFSDPVPLRPAALSKVIGVFVSTNTAILIGFVVIAALGFVATTRRILRGYEMRCRTND